MCEWYASWESLGMIKIKVKLVCIWSSVERNLCAYLTENKWPDEEENCTGHYSWHQWWDYPGSSWKKAEIWIIITIIMIIIITIIINIIIIVIIIINNYFLIIPRMHGLDSHPIQPTTTLCKYTRDILCTYIFQINLRLCFTRSAMMAHSVHSEQAVELFLRLLIILIHEYIHKCIWN